MWYAHAPGWGLAQSPRTRSSFAIERKLYFRLIPSETSEITQIEHLLSSLVLSQIISEPTNFEPNKNPSCIDLVITDQPNLILDSGTRVSLDPYCHHQIIYCKVNFRIPPPPSLYRKFWHFNRANLAAIKKSMTHFPWFEQLNLNMDIDWQVKTFTEIFLNIMSNYIPNETKRFVPRDPPWITKPIKTMLNRKNRLFEYKNYSFRNANTFLKRLEYSQTIVFCNISVSHAYFF